MKVYSIHRARHLVEADVVEALEAGTCNLPHPVVRHEEILLPPHEDVLLLSEIRVVELGALSLRDKRSKRLKPRPVLEIVLLARSPLRSARLERVFVADHFPFEISRQGRVILRKTFDAEIAAKKRLGHVDVLQFDVNFVCRAVTGLLSDEFASRAQERTAVGRENAFCREIMVRRRHGQSV